MWAYSNFVKADVIVDGLIYPTLEHAYQALKTTNKDERAQIRSMDSPGAAKKLGRQATLRADWDKIKDGVMLDLLRDKFSREPQRGLLLSSGDAQLVEWNDWHDRYWGRCTCPRRECKGNGHNKLGVLLMQVRRELKREQERATRQHAPLPMRVAITFEIDPTPDVIEPFTDWAKVAQNAIIESLRNLGTVGDEFRVTIVND